MIDLAMDWGGLKDSENAPNSFFPKINQTLFWRFGTDMYNISNERLGMSECLELLSSLDCKTMVANFFSNQITMWSALLWPGR